MPAENNRFPFFNRPPEQPQGEMNGLANAMAGLALGPNHHPFPNLFVRGQGEQQPRFVPQVPLVAPNAAGFLNTPPRDGAIQAPWAPRRRHY